MTDRASPPPTLTVFVGPNGAGKSSLYRQLIARKPELAQVPYVNADDLTRSLGGSNIAGGRAALTLRKQLLQERVSFAWETTGSGKSELAFLRSAKDQGYRLDVRFVGVSHPKHSVVRVKSRVSSGGHNVSTADVTRRYERVMARLGEYRAIADEFRVYDNSQDKPRLFVLDHERDVLRAHAMPSWIKDRLPADPQLRERADAARELLNRETAAIKADLLAPIEAERRQLRDQADESRQALLDHERSARPSSWLSWRSAKAWDTRREELAEAHDSDRQALRQFDIERQRNKLDLKAGQEAKATAEARHPQAVKDRSRWQEALRVQRAQTFAKNQSQSKGRSR